MTPPNTSEANGASAKALKRIVTENKAQYFWEQAFKGFGVLFTGDGVAPYAAAHYADEALLCWRERFDTDPRYEAISAALNKYASLIGTLSATDIPEHEQALAAASEELAQLRKV